MDCPRCGISVFAEWSTCRDCGWQLSRAFSLSATETLTSVVPRDLSPSALLAAKQKRGEEFVLTPPTELAVVKLRRPRRLRRRARDARARSVPSGARAGPPRRLEVMALPELQSAFDFGVAEQEAERLAGSAAAPVARRLRAALMDGMLIGLANTTFFALFAFLGGEVPLARRALLVYLVAGFALAALYFCLFTLLGGRTPGMQYHGLRVVAFSGVPPSRRETLWRAFGYVVSIGSLLLGFFWAAMDERRLTWHDRISQTFLTDRDTL